jgi:hypothetical protein
MVRSGSGINIPDPQHWSHLPTFNNALPVNCQDPLSWPVVAVAAAAVAAPAVVAAAAAAVGGAGP